MPSLQQQTRLPGCFIPAYWPIDSPRWDSIINTRNAYPNVPFAVVINVTGNFGSGGGAGTSTQTNWSNLISRLTSSNIIVLGYVDTNSATDSTATVNARTDAWKSYYPSIDGIFFDNMSIQTSAKQYYTDVAGYAKTTKGFATTAGNCKVAATVVVPTTQDTWSNGAVNIDTFVIFDGEGLDPVDTSYSKYDTLTNNQLSVWCFGIPSLNTSWNSQMAQYVGWIYVTDGTGTSPYNSLPLFFQDFIANLNTIAGGSGVGGGGTGGAFDKWGVRKLYHTKTGGEEFFTNQDDVLADAATYGRIQNFEGENITKQSDGSHQSDGGSNGDLRLEIASPDYADLNQRLAACWLNAESTIYIKYLSQDGRNPRYVAQLYMKGGHHTTSRPCEGCAYKFRWWRAEDTVSFDKEVCHSSYSGNFAIKENIGVSFGNGQWQGLKAVQYNILENGELYVKLELYADMNCSDANGNLIIKNDWKLLTSHIDRGTNTPPSDSAWSDCNGCGRDEEEVLNKPYEVTNSGSGNYRRNITAYRTDGVTNRFRYYSVREIDPTKPVTGNEPPTGGGGGVNDQFGVLKIYPTITNGYELFMDMSGTSPNTDITKIRAFTAATTNLSKNADGSFKTTDPNTVIHFYQRNGYNATSTSNSAGNHATLASRGYMQDASDFKNVECTGYLRVNNNPGTTGSLQWFCRGGRHLEPTPNCEGSALRGYIFENGQTLCSKEQWHSSFVNATRGVGIGSLLGKWIGFKLIVVTKVVSGTIVTNQQIWIDRDNNNNWVKYDERTDAGGWGEQGGVCNGAPDQLIVWGGPIVQFALSSFNDVDFKNMSVREIDPNAVPAGAPPGDNTSLCGS